MDQMKFEYESPTLPIHEIVEKLVENGWEVTEDDFKRPDPRRWRDIYSKMYTALTKGSIESAIQSVLMTVEVKGSGDNECREEAFVQAAFTQLLRRALLGCCYRDFSFRDVVAPSTEALRKITSMFINRIYNDNNVEEFFEKTLETAQRLGEDFQHTIKKNKEMEQLLSAEEGKHLENKSELQKLEEHVEQLRQTFVSQKELTDKTHESVRGLKLAMSEMEMHKAEMKQTMTQTNQECEKLSKQIVQSPKKFQVETDRTKRRLVDMKSQYTKVEEKLSDSRILLEQTMNKIDVAGKAVKLSNEVQEDADKNSEIDAAQGTASEQLYELQEQMDRISTQMEAVDETLNVRQRRKFKLSTDSGHRQQSNSQKRADFAGYSQKINQGLKSTKAEMQALEESTSQFKTKIKETGDSVAKLKQDLQRQEERYAREFDVLAEVLNTSAEKVRQIN